MGPERNNGLNNFALYLGDTPIARGEIQLADITLPPEMAELREKLDCQCVGLTLTFKTPKRWRCQSRKRFIKLMMSEGISRNYAERLADFVRGWMPYGEAWGQYLWRKL